MSIIRFSRMSSPYPPELINYIDNHPDKIVGGFFAIYEANYNNTNLPEWYHDHHTPKKLIDVINSKEKNNYLELKGRFILVTSGGNDPLEINFMINHVNMSDQYGEYVLNFFTENKIPLSTNIPTLKSVAEEMDIEYRNWDTEAFWRNYCMIALGTDSTFMINEHIIKSGKGIKHDIIKPKTKNISIRT